MLIHDYNNFKPSENCELLFYYHSFSFNMISICMPHSFMMGTEKVNNKSCGFVRNVFCFWFFVYFSLKKGKWVHLIWWVFVCYTLIKTGLKKEIKKWETTKHGVLFFVYHPSLSVFQFCFTVNPLILFHISFSLPSIVISTLLLALLTFTLLLNKYPTVSYLHRYFSPSLCQILSLN